MTLVIDLILPRKRLGKGWGSMRMLRSAGDLGSVIRMSPVATAEPRRLYVYSPLVNADDNVPPLLSCVDIPVSFGSLL